MRCNKQHKLTTKSKGKKFQDNGCTMGQERHFIFRPGLSEFQKNAFQREVEKRALSIHKRNKNQEYSKHFTDGTIYLTPSQILRKKLN